MALKDIVIETVEVEVPGGSFSVRGLSLADISILLRAHPKETAELFEGKITLTGILERVPEFAAMIIAAAAGEPKEVKKAQQLPFGAQLEALSAIWEATQVNPADLGNVIRGILAGVQGLGDSLESESKVIKVSGRTPKS